MPHRFIWVFTVCQITHLGVANIQIFILLKWFNYIERNNDTNLSNGNLKKKSVDRGSYMIIEFIKQVGEKR